MTVSWQKSVQKVENVHLLSGVNKTTSKKIIKHKILWLSKKCSDMRFRFRILCSGHWNSFPGFSLLFNHLSNFRDESIIKFWLSSFCSSLFLQYKPHIGKKKKKVGKIECFNFQDASLNLSQFRKAFFSFYYLCLYRVFVFCWVFFFPDTFAFAVIWLAVFTRPAGPWRRAPRPLAVACCQCRTWVTAWSVWTRRRSCRCSRCRTSAPSCLEVRHLI